MPYAIRPYHRFPVYCPVTYQTSLFEGHGTVWNLSLTGWRFSGDLPLPSCSSRRDQKSRSTSKPEKSISPGL